MARLKVFPDAESVCAAAATELAALAEAAVAGSGRFAVALSGGTTPRRLYQLLAEPPHRERVPWDRLELFWGDERAVPPEHPDSNYGVAAEVLLAKVPVPAERVHRILADRPDLDETARLYQAEIARVLGVPPDGPPPALDLVLLGMGGDGHTASLFPYSRALGERGRWVLAHFVARLGVERITLTPPILNRAREVRILVTGSDKAPTLRAVLEGPREPERLPAQLIKPGAGRLVWLVDEAAAAELSPSTLAQAVRAC